MHRSLQVFHMKYSTRVNSSNSVTTFNNTPHANGDVFETGD